MTYVLLPGFAEVAFTALLALLLWYVVYGAVNWMFAGAYSVLDKQEDWAERIEHKS